VFKDLAVGYLASHWQRSNFPDVFVKKFKNLLSKLYLLDAEQLFISQLRNLKVDGI